MQRFLLLLAALASLTSCGPERKDYESSAACQQAGKTPGTAAYDACLSQEKSARLLEQQRREFEQMQQERQDQKSRRF